MRYNEDSLIGAVAQLAEQQTLNLRVGGSIPPRLTKSLCDLVAGGKSGEVGFALTGSPNMHDSPASRLGWREVVRHDSPRRSNR